MNDAEKLHENMTEFGYNPDAEWQHSEEWIHDQTPGSYFGPGIRATRKRDEESLKAAMAAGYTKENPGPAGKWDYAERYQRDVDRHSPENMEKLRIEEEGILHEASKRGESWALQHTTPNRAYPGGYEIKRWTPSGTGPHRRSNWQSNLEPHIEIPGISPGWNHPMLGPGQIPSGETGANHELLPDETERDYITRVVWPMYGGPEQIAWEDLPGAEAWRKGKSPWYDPLVPWPSNVPKSPQDRSRTDASYGHGPAANISLPALPEGSRRRSQHQPILRQERGTTRPWSDIIKRTEEWFENQ